MFGPIGSHAMLRTFLEERRVKKTFEKLVTPEVVEAVLEKAATIDTLAKVAKALGVRPGDLLAKL
jgi:hypothetical protein